jgi:type VI secretion system secreted protein Hcp
MTFPAIIRRRKQVPFSIVIESSKQGAISGDGPDGVIEGISFQHELTTPTDSASGMATGKLRHEPLSIVKRVDRATVPLMNALLSGERLKRVTLEFLRPADLTAKPGPYYRIQLENVRLIGVRQFIPSDLVEEDDDQVKAGEYEEITLTYQQISWTWADGGLTAQVDVLTGVDVR